MNVENIKKFQVDLGNLQAYIVREMVTIKEFEDMHPQLFSPITTRPRTTLPDTTNFKIQGIRVVQGGFASTNLRADILCQSNQPGGHDTQLVSLPVSGDMAEDYANTVRNWFNETTDSIATFVTVEPDGFSSKASVAGTLPVGSGPGSVEVSLVTSGPEFSIHPSLIQTVTAPAPTVRMDLSNYAATLNSLHHLSGNHQPTGRVFLSGTVGECSDPLIIDARFEHPYTDHVILVVLLGFTVLFVQQVDLDRYKLFVPAHAAKSFGQSTMEFDHRVLAELDTRAGRQLGHYTISLADLERHEGGLRPVLNWRGKNIPGANLDFQKTQAWVNDDRSNRTMFYANGKIMHDNGAAVGQPSEDFPRSFIMFSGPCYGSKHFCIMEEFKDTQIPTFRIYQHVEAKDTNRIAVGVGSNQSAIVPVPKSYIEYLFQTNELTEYIDKV